MRRRRGFGRRADGSVPSHDETDPARNGHPTWFCLDRDDAGNFGANAYRRRCARRDSVHDSRIVRRRQRLRARPR